VDQLHDGVGAPRRCGAGVENLGDISILHHRPRLRLRVEAGDDLLGVHAWLDDLENDPAADGLSLLSDEH
jgi:hypothetical protein